MLAHLQGRIAELTAENAQLRRDAVERELAWEARLAEAQDGAALKAPMSASATATATTAATVAAPTTADITPHTVGTAAVSRTKATSDDGDVLNVLLQALQQAGLETSRSRDELMNASAVLDDGTATALATDADADPGAGKDVKVSAAGAAAARDAVVVVDTRLSPPRGAAGAASLEVVNSDTSRNHDHGCTSSSSALTTDGKADCRRASASDRAVRGGAAVTPPAPASAAAEIIDGSILSPFARFLAEVEEGVISPTLPPATSDNRVDSTVEVDLRKPKRAAKRVQGKGKETQSPRRPREGDENAPTSSPRW